MPGRRPTADAAESEAKFLRAHRAHDVDALLREWRRVARAADCAFETLITVGGYPVVGLRSRAARAGVPGIYLCAGVHGDEAAGGLGLLEWASHHTRLLRSGPFMILPCFNPVGTALNTRGDGRGIDLNRRFDRPRDRHVAAWRRFIRGMRFRLALTLHEDYDAQGIYLYELRRAGAPWGGALIDACADLIPPDPRSRIDGRRASNGVMDVRRRTAGLAGMPEAIVLHQEFADVTLTFETPSEFSLFPRVAAHRRFIESALAMDRG